MHGFENTGGYMQSITHELNEAQEKAVTLPLTNTLVLAGAGSGKTRVLVHRMAWLIAKEGIRLEQILAVTFTNKAANEMRERLSPLIDAPKHRLWVGTFHGIAHRILRRYYEKAGLPESFQILDSDDQLRLIKRTIKALNIDEEHWPPKKVQWFINGKKDEGIRADKVEDYGELYTRTLKQIYQAYDEALKRGGLLDFAELLLRVHELFLQDKALLSHFQHQFKVILIDEFQDTNTIQYAWMRLLASGGATIMAVGDDDQSIYGWRGAKIENIQRFSRDFKNTEVIRLEQNYRSTQNILQAANALIDNNAKRMGKTLWTAGEEGSPISLYCAFNEMDEARFICERVMRLKADEHFSLRECAILYRSNAQSRVLEEMLLRQGIPYRIYGGFRFFERAEIKDVLAYLRLVSNSYDDAAFERVVNLPTRGIGDRTLTVLRSYSRDNNVSLWQAATSLLDEKAFSNRAHQALSGFLNLIEQLKMNTASLSLDETVRHVITHSGLWAHYSQSKSEKATSKLENMEELVTAAKEFSQEERDIAANLSEFLNHASLEAGEGEASIDEDAIQLMTLHSAKGLEFPIVFIAGLEEGVFPSYQSVDEPGRLEEERRLCYVGITRARQHLYLTYAEVRRLYGREEYHRPSRFIRELPQSVIEEVRLSAKAPIVKRAPFKRIPLEKEAKGFTLGQSVSHKTFGEGTVLAFEGSGESQRVQVRFPRVGSKWLVLKYAQLQ